MQVNITKYSSVKTNMASWRPSSHSIRMIRLSLNLN